MSGDEASDHIIIRGLRAETHIGVSSEERSAPQVVVIDVDARVDLRSASASDELRETVDYGGLTRSIAEVVRGHRARLLERLAESIARLVLQQAGVGGVSVEVAKESPPLSEEVDRVAVRIERP